MNYEPLAIDLIRHSTACRSISYFESIDSTNNYLLEHGKCGDICISEEQIKGKGRRGNQWVSPQTGNIYYSQYWCFDSITKHWPLLGLIAGIAIAEALQDIGLKGHGVKWPNDIYWQGKKLGGILLEAPDQSGKVVIGIGLNINMSSIAESEIAQPFISLNNSNIVMKTFSRDKLVIALIKRLQDKLENFTQFSIDPFREEWKAWDILRGEIVSFQHQGKTVIGEVQDIDENGRLGVLTKNDVRTKNTVRCAN